MLFGRINIKSFLGGNLALFAVVSGVVSPMTAASVPPTEPEINTLEVGQQPFATEVSVQYPLSPVIVNQGYRFYHPGLDFDGITGEPVRPIMKGKVVKTEYSRYAYGNSVVVDHENGHQSLYAHLSRIYVKAEDVVDTRSVVGAVGSTGRSTGDHLHLEVYKEGKNVNPLTVLPR